MEIHSSSCRPHFHHKAEKMRPISSLTRKSQETFYFLKFSQSFATGPTNSILSKFKFTASVSNKFTTETCTELLGTCILHKNFILGKVIHAKVVIRGLDKESFVITKLIGLYSSCGCLQIAELVLNQFSNINVFLMNALIRGYCMNGFYQQALDFFYQKKKQGLKPDSYTFSCLLKACGSLSDLEKGNMIYNLAVNSGLDIDVFVSNSLITMYAKCGSLPDAIEVFERMPHRDTVSWNSIITAYIQEGFEWDAMFKVREMIRIGLRPDDVTSVSALTVCSSVAMVREIHAYVIASGYENTLTVLNSLISMYGKFGQIEEARWIFDTTVNPDNSTWNAVISSYAQNDQFDKSIQLLRRMKHRGFDSDVITYSGIISSFSQKGLSDQALRFFEELLNSGLKPDVITIASILPSISDLQYLDFCREIHAYSCRSGLESDRRVRNALISAYCKCGSIQNAVEMFSKIMNRDVISWSSIIVGYVQNSYFNEALDTFRQMIMTETEPNPITVTSILSACAGISSLRHGKEVHLWALKNKFEAQTFVSSALIDMYAKCGKIKDSRRVFDLMTEKNLVTWNTMIGGYAFHGLGENALEIFWRVDNPDEITFIAALSACSHGGLVNEGIDVFNSMKSFGVKATEGHYASMVDILGRSGRLDQALELIQKMPIEANADIWGALLGACKMHSSLDIAVYSGARVVELGSKNPGYYVLLSNILADFGKWEDVEMIRKLMKEKGVKKVVGCSWIEVNKGVYSFFSREAAQHPEWESLFKILKGLNEQMKGIW